MFCSMLTGLALATGFAAPDRKHGLLWVSSSDDRRSVGRMEAGGLQAADSSAASHTCCIPRRVCGDRSLRGPRRP
jgi:hypothetical protein